jgi:hypothetical protein
MAPRRPAVYPEQWSLVVFSALLLVGGIAFVIWAVWG